MGSSPSIPVHPKGSVMRGLIFSSHDSPAARAVSISDQIPRPNGSGPDGALGPNQLLIQVYASSLNPIDLIRITGGLKALRPEPYFPAVVGYDASGVVLEVGSNVTRIKVGSRVFVRTLEMNHGSTAEYLITNEAQVSEAPSNINFPELASIPLAGQTALQALRRAGVTQGSRVFISGGAGGVGTLAIQIARLLGASFVGTSASGAKVKLCKDLGADEVIDYKERPLFFNEPELKESYDAVFDTTHQSFQLVPLLKQKGNMVTVSDTPTVESLQEVGLDPNFIVKIFLNVKRNTDAEKAVAAKGGKWSYMFLKPNHEDLSTLGNWLAEKKLRAVIDTVVPLDEAVKAVEKLESGRAAGKCVIVIKQEQDNSNNNNDAK